MREFLARHVPYGRRNHRSTVLHMLSEVLNEHQV